MPIEANKVVTMNFTLTDETGNILDSTDAGGPFSYISGTGMVLPKLEESCKRYDHRNKETVKT
ncbi:MAG: hypothetical protein IPI19_15985 [Ignavibacteriales bacterium]|nr:hypothetical protein [Ignavibacteriales bacterium]